MSSILRVAACIAVAANAELVDSSNPHALFHNREESVMNVNDIRSIQLKSAPDLQFENEFRSRLSVWGLIRSQIAKIIE